MPLTDHRSRVATVQRLADAATTVDGRRALRLLAHVASTPPGNDHAALSDPPAGTPAARIGIWQRTLEDGQAVYGRKASGEPRRFWADVERIAGQGGFGGRGPGGAR